MPLLNDLSPLDEDFTLSWGRGLHTCTNIAKAIFAVIFVFSSGVYQGWLLDTPLHRIMVGRAVKLGGSKEEWTPPPWFGAKFVFAATCSSMWFTAGIIFGIPWARRKWEEQRLERSGSRQRSAALNLSAHAAWKSVRNWRRGMVTMLVSGGQRGRGSAFDRVTAIRGLCEHIFTLAAPCGFMGFAATVLKHHSCRVQCLASLPARWPRSEKEVLLSGSYDETIALWKREPPNKPPLRTRGRSNTSRPGPWLRKQTWKAHDDCVMCLTLLWVEDESFIRKHGWRTSVVASASDDGTIRLWRFIDFSHPPPSGPPPGGPPPGQPATGKSHCGHFAPRTGGAVMALLPLRSPTLNTLRDEAGEKIVRLVSAHDDGIFRVWRFSNMRGSTAPDGTQLMIRGVVEFSARAHKDATRCLTLLDVALPWCFNGLGAVFATGSHDKTVKVWEYSYARETPYAPPHMQCDATLTGHTEWVSAVESLDGWWSRRAPGSNAHARESSSSLDGGSGGSQVALGKEDEVNPRLLASASWDDTIRVWDRTARVCLQILRGHTADVNCLALLSSHLFKDHVTDDKEKAAPCRAQYFLASGSDDCTIRVWRIEAFGRCNESIALRGHTDHVTRLFVMDHGATLVSASLDSTVRMWKKDSSF